MEERAVSPTDRFWALVDRSGDCWTRRSDPSTADTGGYWSFGIDGRSISAHRYAWVITNGEIPDGQQVCHSCDNRGCVRPSHLFLGTAKENAHDRREKGRTVGVRAYPDYTLRDMDPELWAAVKARAASEGRGLRWVVLTLLAHYAAHGLPK